MSKTTLFADILKNALKKNAERAAEEIKNLEKRSSSYPLLDDFMRNYSEDLRSGFQSNRPNPKNIEKYLEIHQRPVTQEGSGGVKNLSIDQMLKEIEERRVPSAQDVSPDGYKFGGPINMKDGGDPILVTIEKAKEQTNELKKGGAVKMNKGGIAKSIADMIKEIRKTRGGYEAKRLERAADEVPNLERLYQEEALRGLFRGDNARGIMTMKPEDFERYAIPLGIKSSVGPKAAELAKSGDISKETVTTAEYIKHLGGIRGGFDDVPFLQVNKEEAGLPLLPYISGHEGRHRMRAMAGKRPSAIVQFLPRSELREPFPRRSREEYIDALNSELNLSGKMILPESDGSVVRPAIKLPDVYKTGGAVKMGKGGIAKSVAEMSKEMMKKKPSVAAKEPTHNYDDVINSMNRAKSCQNYLNCQLAVQLASGVSDIKSLPTVKSPDVGDIHKFGIRHYAIDVGDGYVVDVPQWGGNIEKKTLKEVVDEYGPPTSTHRPPSGSYLQNKAKGGAVKMRDGGDPVRAAIEQAVSSGKPRRPIALTAPTQQDIDRMRAEIAENARRVAAVKSELTPEAPVEKKYSPALRFLPEGTPESIKWAFEKAAKDIGPSMEVVSADGKPIGVNINEGGFGDLLSTASALYDVPATVAGEEVFRRTGSPAAAAAAYTLTDPIGAVTGAPVAGRAAVKAGKALVPTLGKTAEQYMMRTGMALPIDVWHGSPHRFQPTAKNPLGEFASKAKKEVKEYRTPAKFERVPAKTKEEIEELARRMAPQYLGEFVRKPESTFSVAGKSMKQYKREKDLPIIYSGDRPTPDVFDISKHEGSVMVGVPGDPTIAHRTLEQIGDIRPETPVKLYGGPLYGLEGEFWASGKGPATGLQATAQRGSEAYGGVPVLGKYIRMPEGTPYALHTTDALLQFQRPDMLGNKKLQQLNAEIRRGNLKNKFPEFVGFEDPDLVLLQAQDNPNLRKHINNVLLKPTTTEKYGLRMSGPDIDAAITEAELRNLETGSTGFSVGRLYPKSNLTESAHPTYEFDIPGRLIGQTRYPQPYELSFPDTLKFARENLKPGVGEFGMFKMIGPRQIIDSQLVDEIKMYEEAMKRLTGKKQGGPVYKSSGGILKSLNAMRAFIKASKEADIAKKSKEAVAKGEVYIPDEETKRIMQEALKPGMPEKPEGFADGGQITSDDLIIEERAL